MNIIAIIPARMGSTRFPGKPLAEICGTPMIGLVYQRTIQSHLVDQTYIATCDQEIKEYADSIGAPCIMTSNLHERCTDRTAEALLKIESKIGKKADIVVMVQGDEPMITGEMVDDSVRAIVSNSSVDVVNLMSTIKTVEEFEDPNEVKVVVSCRNKAIYFSREPIPSRKKGLDNVPMYKQVCVIPFRRQMLLDFNSMDETPLERYESVDMLRLIENGIDVTMVKTDEETYSVDTIEDLKKVEKKQYQTV